MGKGILFFIAAAVLSAGVYGFTGKQSGRATADRQASHEQEILARNAALAGYSLARQMLVDNFAAANRSGEFGDGTFTVSIAVAGDVAHVSSKGVYGSSELEVIAEFRREMLNVFDVVPPFMRYALLTDGPLSLRGDILGEIYVAGSDVSRLNANMHTNDALSVHGNSVRVHGFGTYVTTASFSSENAAKNSFRPNYNPSSADPVNRTAAVSIPALNTSEYLTTRTPDQTTAGDVTLSGSYDFGGQRENPYVWHVTGNLTFSSATTFSGYVLFLVDQDVLAYGDVSVASSGYDGADESSLALYAGRRIELGGSSTVYAQLFAGGDVVFLNGTPTVFGSVTSKGAADLRGTPQIYYRNASPALTSIWQDSKMSVRLTSYQERQL